MMPRSAGASGHDERVAVDEADVGDRALADEAPRPDEERLVEPVPVGETLVIALPEPDGMLDVGGGPLVLDRLQALPLGRRGGGRPHADHDGHVGGGVGAEDVHPDRCVRVVRERVPDGIADAVAVETDAEQLPRGTVQTDEVEVQTERGTAPDLHRGEVTGHVQVEGPDLLERGGLGRRSRPGEVGRRARGPSYALAASVAGARTEASARPVSGRRSGTGEDRPRGERACPAAPFERASTRAQNTAGPLVGEEQDVASPSSLAAASVSSVSTGGASIVNMTLTSEPSSSVTSARTVDRRQGLPRPHGRVLEVRRPDPQDHRRAPRRPPSRVCPASGISNPANADGAVVDLGASTRFIGGEPMNAATNRFAGCL